MLQVATWRSRFAFLGFVVLIPLLHASAVFKYATIYTTVPLAASSLYEAIGGAGLAAAFALNAWAASTLGAAYDRVVAPERLVTAGPYRLVQHPIYASYMLAFFSFAMLLHAAPTGLAMLAVCATYYSARTALEARVLREAFGEAYSEYAVRTKRFIPGLV